MAKKKEEQAKVQEKFVQYVGTSDIRQITKSDWRSIGITHEGVEWNKANGWKIAASRLEQPVLEYLEKDREFVIQ